MVSNAFGSNTLIKSKYIEVDGTPFANFTLDRTLTLIPQPITVNSTSTGSPLWYNWSWGDGTATNQTGGTPGSKHSYTRVGFYQIYLTASNAAGSSNSGKRWIYAYGW
jgi:PKD repeat protein